MHDLGSNVGMLRKNGFSGFDSAHQAWNQYVGSVYHYHAVDNLTNTIQWRIANVKYAKLEGEPLRISKITQTRPNSEILNDGNILNASFKLTGYMGQGMRNEDKSVLLAIDKDKTRIESWVNNKIEDKKTISEWQGVKRYGNGFDRTFELFSKAGSALYTTHPASIKKESILSESDQNNKTQELKFGEGSEVGL